MAVRSESPEPDQAAGLTEAIAIRCLFQGSRCDR
jgi:hypothetical protein